MKYNVAILGATGAVGREMIKILEERNFPVVKIKLMATERSSGTRINFKGESVEVETHEPGKFKDIDIALFSAGSSASLKIAPAAVKEGAVVIDNSNAFRMDDSVPLIVPEVNPQKISEHSGIIANPNCSTIQLVVALKPIYDKFGIKRIVVNTYQAVSGTGKDAVRELETQISQYIDNSEIINEVYPYQIAFNALPHIDVFQDNGYTKEEMKIIRETRKILDDSKIAITSTAVRIGVFNGHCEAVNVETEKEFTLEEIREILDSFEGVKVVDNPSKNKYPMPLMVDEDDNVLVGRIRRDDSIENGLNLWIVANNLRKGAALNTVQIAEKMIENPEYLKNRTPSGG